MLADLRIEQFDEMRLEAFVRPLLVGTHQARITHPIGGKDRGETAGRGRSGHCSGGFDSLTKNFILLRVRRRQFRTTERSANRARHNEGAIA